MVIQIRCPGMGGGPFLAEVLRILEKSYSKTGGAGCPERGSFIDRRLHHRPVEDIGVKLHEQIVLHHASIYSEHLKARATVFLHCLDHFPRLKRSCLQNRSREMALFAYRVNPVITPRALCFQYGAYSPENAGTKYTPPLSSTDRASVSISELVPIKPRLSRSHCTSAPVIAMLPSSA